MASNKTPNYNLDIWAETDYFKRTELNGNFTKLDTTIKDNKSKIDDLSANVSAQNADRAAKNITDDYINVLKPPAPFSPLQIGINSSYKDSNSTRLQALLDNLDVLKIRKLFFPFGVYYFGTGLIVKHTKVQFIGVYNDIDVRHGTQLVYFGSGAFFTFGTEIPQSQYGDNLYSGLEDIAFKNLMLEGGSADTNLNNSSLNKYKAGSRGIQDNGGGSLTLENTTIQRFEYGAYLVQSDFNKWSNSKFLYNKTGVYISSRSDQNIWTRADFTMNELAIWVDGPMNLTLYSPNFVKNGAGGSYGDIESVKVTNGSITIYSPWIESYNLRVNETLPCFIRAGVAVGWNNTLTSCNVKVYNPLVTAGLNNLIEFNKAVVAVEGIQEVSKDINALAYKKGSEVGSFFYYLGSTLFDQTKILKQDADATNGSKNGIMAAYNQMRFSGQRFYFEHPTNSLQTIYFEGSNDNQFSLRTGTKDIFYNVKKTTLERSLYPTSGTYEQGDYCKNNAPQELGTTGSKYLILGWMCTQSGSPGVWKECRVLTGG